MAIITAAVLTALNTMLRKEFSDAYAAARAASVYQRIATTVPSTTASTTYDWLGDFPDLREWVGARVVRDMKAQGYQITNRLFEGTVGVQRTAIEDDSHGVYGPLAARMGQSAAQHPDKLLAALMAGGNAALCYDGQFFFDTDHPVYPNVDGTGVATTVSNYNNGGGSPGPAWYLLDTRSPLRPFIFQERTKPEFESKTNPATSDAVFDVDQFKYGVRYRCNGGYAFWQMAYCSRAALNAANFEAARLAMEQLTADGGRPLGISPNLIVVSAANRSAAQNLFDMALIGGGNSNPNYKAVEIIVSPWLV